ncbi:hypothetical protein PALS2_105 [Staphylococcus phage PALS_2]|nr:hypothetical protein PALS2_105 [Staphylococcus phage PALS_2]
MLLENFVTIIVLLGLMKFTGCFKFMKEIWSNKGNK